jgi:hypothetical protein
MSTTYTTFSVNGRRPGGKANMGMGMGLGEFHADCESEGPFGSYEKRWEGCWVRTAGDGRAQAETTRRERERSRQNG